MKEHFSSTEEKPKSVRNGSPSGGRGMNETHGDTSVQIGTPAVGGKRLQPQHWCIQCILETACRVPQRRDALHHYCSFTESPDRQAFLPCLVSLFPSRDVGERLAFVIYRTNSTELPIAIPVGK
eukprot:s422_g22.t1